MNLPENCLASLKLQSKRSGVRISYDGSRHFFKVSASIYLFWFETNRNLT